MRAKKARRVRREALPPDLASEAQALVVAAAQIRSAKSAAAKNEYDNAEYAARTRRNRAVAEAERDFQTTRQAILEEAHAEAARREPAAA